MKTLLVILTLIMALAGCATLPQIETPKQFEFNSFVNSHLGEKTRASKPPYCGNWLSFLRGVVKAESNWNTNAVYKEKFKDAATGDYALSVGYFQISVGDKLNYKTPYCQSLTEQTIKDPETNTGCALEIIERLIKVGRPLGAYWSVVRDGKVKCDG